MSVRGYESCDPVPLDAAGVIIPLVSVEVMRYGAVNFKRWWSNNGKQSDQEKNWRGSPLICCKCMMFKDSLLKMCKHENEIQLDQKEYITLLRE